MACRLGNRVLLLAGLVLAVDRSEGTGARAQDDWGIPKKPEVQIEQLDDELPDFDQYVFQGRRRDQIEQSIKAQFAVRLESVNRVCTLSDAQREKITLAAEGDRKRLLRRIGQAQEKHRTAGQDQKKIQEFYNVASSLRTKLDDVYDEWSLYQKILRQTLTKEQWARYDRQERERDRFRYQAKIEMVMTRLENGLVAFHADQRQRLIKLLLDETEAPKKFGKYDYYVVLFQLAKLNDEKLKPIFDDAQRQAIKKATELPQSMELTLRRQGYLP